MSRKLSRILVLSLSLLPFSAHPNVGLVLSSNSPIVTGIGTVFDVQLIAAPDLGANETIGALDVCLTWNPLEIELVGSDSGGASDANGPYDWFQSGFLLPGGPNTSFVDGDGVWTGFGQFLNPFVSEPGGSTMTTLRFRAASPTPTNAPSIIRVVGALPGGGLTAVYSGDGPNINITGALGQAAVQINPVRKIVGHVLLQDFGGPIDQQTVVIEVFEPGGDTPLITETAALDGSGGYQVTSALPIGTYDVRAKASHWLAVRSTGVVLTGADTTGVDFSLLNGDVDGDNTVTVFDYSRLSDAFDTGPSDPAWDAMADLDGDEAVTVFDYAILSDNFDRNGDA